MSVLRAKKSYGQHFLTDERVLHRIVDLVKQGSEELIVEVGPGGGALTQFLYDLPAKLTLVEADRDLFEDLRARFSRAVLVEGDAARVQYDEVARGVASWVLVGNLPYNAAAAILAQVMREEFLPERMIVMVQKEQGDRLRAEKGDMGLLSVVAQLSYTVLSSFLVAPGSFSPRPRIDSSVLLFTKRQEVLPPDVREAVIRLAKLGFSSRRKQLHKNLSEAGIGESAQIKSLLVQMGFSEQARAQELGVDDWVELRGRL